MHTYYTLQGGICLTDIYSPHGYRTCGLFGGHLFWQIL